MSKIKKIVISDILIFLLIVVLILIEKKPTTVQGLTIEDTTYNSVSLSWDESNNASGYNVYRSANDKDFEFIDVTSETQFEDKNLQTGTTYTYAVSSYNGIKRSKRETIKTTPSLEVPKLESDISSGKAVLSITGVEGASGYKIYRNNKEIDSIASTNKNIEYTDDSADADEDYSYTIKAYRGDALSEASNNEKIKLISAGKIIAEAGTSDIKLSWDGDYSSYKLYKDDKLITETTDNDYLIPAEVSEFTLKLVGYSDDIQSPETVQKFKVTEEAMDNQGAINAACEWAVKIANDDSFTYGVGQRAHRFGCYFCKTNVGPNLNLKGASKVNGHSYAKTYCCNPFVSAAYAHGAGDKAMLKACQSGHGIGMKKSSYTRYGSWKDMGKPAFNNLKRGDVLVRSTHVALYLGDGKYVQAGGEGWGANTIAVSDFTKKKYNSFSYVMRYTGTGSGTMYKIEDITKE